MPGGFRVSGADGIAVPAESALPVFDSTGFAWKPVACLGADVSVKRLLPRPYSV